MLSSNMEKQVPWWTSLRSSGTMTTFCQEAPSSAKASATRKSEATQLGPTKMRPNKLLRMPVRRKNKTTWDLKWTVKPRLNSSTGLFSSNKWMTTRPCAHSIIGRTDLLPPQGVNRPRHSNPVEPRARVQPPKVQQHRPAQTSRGLRRGRSTKLLQQAVSRSKLSLLRKRRQRPQVIIILKTKFKLVKGRSSRAQQGKDLLLM